MRQLGSARLNKLKMNLRGVLTDTTEIQGSIT